MDSFKTKIVKFILIFIFLISMLYANFYAVRKMMSLGAELYFYDKLAVAYDIAGDKGIKDELKSIFATDGKYPRELVLAKEFEIKLKDLENPGIFLKINVDQLKNSISRIRNLRSIAIVLMLLIFSWRLIVNLLSRRRKVEY